MAIRSTTLKRRRAAKAVPATRHGKPWTDADDYIALRYTPAEAEPMLGGRTRESIIQRRFELRNPTEIRTSLPRDQWAAWTNRMEQTLKDHYWSASRETLETLLGLKWTQIKSKARHLKIKRKSGIDSDMPTETAFPLVTAVRLRAKAKGIPFYELDKHIGTGRYFKSEWARSKTVRLGNIVKAVEFLGGEINVTWKD